MTVKTIIIGSFLFYFFLLSHSFNPVQSQTISLNQEKIEYNLPYPGILPDHPLFFLKDMRDKFLEFATRDSMKKAEFYLLLSDKKVAMSLNLAKNGKEKSASSAFAEAEEDFAKIPPLIETSKKQGVSATSEFILKLKLSNSKHKEVGTNLLKDLSRNYDSELSKALELNQKIKSQIEKL